MRIPSDAPTCLVMAIAKQDQQKEKKKLPPPPPPPKQSVSKTCTETKNKDVAPKEHTGASKAEDRHEEAKQKSEDPLVEEHQPQPPPSPEPESGGCCCLLM